MSAENPTSFRTAQGDGYVEADRFTADAFVTAVDTVAGSTGTGAAIGNAGVTTISSTGGTRNYSLASPITGVSKTLFCTAGSTANLAKVDAGAGVTFDGSNRYATFNGAGDCLDLVGLSSTRWLIRNNVGSVALSTS